jgi:hypothetical protein
LYVHEFGFRIGFCIVKIFERFFLHLGYLLYAKCTPSEESDQQELKNKMTKNINVGKSDVTKMGKVAGSHVAKVLRLVGV